MITLFLTAPPLLADRRQEKSPLGLSVLVFNIGVTVWISSESCFNVCQQEVHAWSQLFISHTGILVYHILAMLCNAALCAVGQGCWMQDSCCTIEPACESSSDVTLGWRALLALEQEQLHFVPATPQTSRLIRVHYQDSLGVPCGL